MFTKTIRSTLIAIFQFILPAIILTPLFLTHKTQLSQLKRFLTQQAIGFLLIHVLFYLALFGLWPRLLHAYIKHHHDRVSREQIKSAMSARTYLLSVLVFFEVLFWWR